jgi:hypothetical protein
MNTWAGAVLGGDLVFRLKLARGSPLNLFWGAGGSLGPQIANRTQPTQHARGSSANQIAWFCKARGEIKGPALTVFFFAAYGR